MGDTDRCPECGGDGLDVALNGRIVGDCRACKGSGAQS